MEQFIFGLLKFITQILWLITKLLLKGFGWSFHQGFKSIGAAVNSKNILILGPGESLQPGVKYREFFDYSQTAHGQEVGDLALGNGEKWLSRRHN